MGGYSTATVGVTEQFNGTAWTEVADLGTARYYAHGAGTSTAGLTISGRIGPPNTVNVEDWDGSSWTEVANVATARYGAGSSGSNTAALFIGGAPETAVTEEWTVGQNVKVITD